jgi:hypothetical protein
MQNNTVTSEETYNNIIISTDETIVEVTQPVTNVIEIATIGPQGPPGLPGDTIFQDIGNNTYRTTSSIEITGSLNVSGSINGTASYSENSKFAEFSNIEYVDNSNVFSLGQIEVIDFSEDVAVTFVNGRLKFIFGNPAIPTIDTFTFNNTFATNRFNQIIDNYDISGSFSIGGYTLISASIYTGSTLLASTSDPLNTSLFFNLNESGSQAYRFEITSSNPLTSVINSQSISLTGTLNKTLPGIPTISPTATVQLGASNFQIEQGATGSIIFTSNTGSANGWEYIPTTLITNLSSPIEVTGSNTGSSPISISAFAQYQSPIGDNIPQIFSTRNSSITTYTKIKSLRYGASISSSFILPELEDLDAWDTSLGGSIGTIAKGITTVSGQTLTIYWIGDKYQYIAYNSSLPDLTAIVSSGFNVLPTQFDPPTTVGGYKIYRTKVLQSGYGGTSITYTLT